MILRRPRASSSQRNIYDSNSDSGGNDLPNGNSCKDKFNVTASRRNDAPKLPSLLQRFRHLASAQRPAVIASIISGMVVISILLLQLHASVREYQGPLDHVTTSLWEPYYGMFCPDFSFGEDQNSNSTDEYSNTISWDCTINTIRTNNSFEGELMPEFPRIYMIGARDKDEDNFHSWRQTFHNNGGGSQSQYIPHLERINTLKISNQYALSGGKLRQSTDNKNHHLNTSIVASSPRALKNPNQKQYLCRKMKWEHRLFAVYQTVFSQLLSTYPHDPGFVIVEDDAVLKNPNAFVQEVCNAHHHQLEFYSLYRSPLQWKGRRSSSCIYLHGTVAFYIRRPIMEKIVNERRRGWFCRFPIDMYISKMGPWYATRRDVVDHLDLGRIGST